MTAVTNASPPRGQLEAELAQQLSGVARSLCVKCWEPKDLDRQLRHTLNKCLTMLDAVGVVAHFSSEKVTLRHWTLAGAPDEAARKAIVERVQALGGESGEIALADEAGFHIVSRPILPARTDGRAAGYCALVFPGATALDPMARKQFDNFHANSTVGLIFQVLHHRVRIFSPFAAGVAERYWDESLSAGADRLRPPWEHDEPLLTATLSLDLRKSTFCMENALRPDEFADWLDDLVQILTAVAHLHGGVFDKFTGDGALVHFLERESFLIYNTDGLTAALDCSVSMHRAMTAHVERLRRMLHYNSKILGAAIGIDQHLTFWSVDRRNNPITVGAGVVGACRVGDSAKAGATRMTNGAYHALQKTRDLGEFVEVDFASKEYKPEMEVTVWELPPGSHPLVREADATDAIVAEVHRKRDATRAPAR